MNHANTENESTSNIWTSNIIALVCSSQHCLLNSWWIMR
jgi:hypothetical protein